MLDSRFLPRAEVEFVVLGDTHYVLPDVEPVEFPSRREQTARIEHAIDEINALAPDFVVHMGDLVQAFPESDRFDEAMDGALAQLDRLESPVHFVAGNHDVGDKPDPTMPTDPVTERSLAAYHDRVGRSWGAWERRGSRFVVLNSQIMNSSLEAAADQRAWAEERLTAVDDGPAFVFLHLPPYLHRPDDPGRGHYDCLAEPARSWVRDLVEEHPVATLFAGHCHFAVLNRVGSTELRVVPSVSFTRPGFAELYSSCPPPERGRNEAEKLGFYLVRVVDGDPSIQFVRTGGRPASDRRTAPTALVTRTAGDLPDARVGVSLLDSVTNTATIPETFPSSVSYPVTDPYPTLGLLEMGAAVVRLPTAGFEDGPADQYLRALRKIGVTVVGTVLDEPKRPIGLADVDELEVRLSGGVEAVSTLAAAMDALETEDPAAINLSAVALDRNVPGKQHGRLRNGFSAAALGDLAAGLGDHDLAVDRVTCTVPARDDPWRAVLTGPEPGSFDRIGEVDWLLSSTNRTTDEAVTRVARAVMAASTRPDSRLYLEPLRSMDRTMDAAPGLLDRRGNPTAAHSAAACLNTLLFRSPAPWSVADRDHRPPAEVIGVRRGTEALWLLHPPGDAGSVTVDLPNGATEEACTVVALSRGVVRPAPPGGGGQPRQITVDEPLLLYVSDGRADPVFNRARVR